MKKTIIIIGVILLLVSGCEKPRIIQYQPINLGTISKTTGIKSVSQTDNVITVVFETTIGSKYSVQITPFGEDTPVIKEGFTAVDNTTQKVYDLSRQSKRDYDLTFIDIMGKEIKYPIVVK